jgi:itaconate CoA-transferase
MGRDIGHQTEYKTKLTDSHTAFEQIRTNSIDAFLVTVSPMDRHGYFTFGTNNDYTSTAARAAKRLIVEVNQHMPRAFGRSQLHISEVAAIVENEAPLLAR